MNRILDSPDYHLMVCTAPFRGGPPGNRRWRIEVVPRIPNVAGFEWATGVFVNQVHPSQAAERYRTALAGA